MKLGGMGKRGRLQVKSEVMCNLTVLSQSLLLQRHKNSWFQQVGRRSSTILLESSVERQNKMTTNAKTLHLHLSPHLTSLFSCVA